MVTDGTSASGTKTVDGSSSVAFPPDVHPCAVTVAVLTKEAVTAGTVQVYVQVAPTTNTPPLSV